jgi:hypothetical protein
VPAVGGEQHRTKGGERENRGGVSCKSAGEAVTVTARQLTEAIQRGVAAYLQVVAAFL